MGSYLCLHLSHSISNLATLHRTANSLLSKSSSTFQPHLVLHRRCFYSDRVFSASASIDTRELRSTDLVALEYADLNLPNKVSGDLGHVRIRQHVNPLSSSNIVPVQVPDWNEVYKDPTLPLMVDIGCGSGRFLLWLARRNRDSGNYLGLEIRQKMVSTYPGPLVLVSILCPDPHFKKRHRKRRVVQKPLVDSIVTSLMHGGKVFVQSDVLEVALDMRDQFDAELDMLRHIDAIDPSVACDEEGWLLNNPMGIRTEREIHAEFEGAKIYRRMYQKVYD